MCRRLFACASLKPTHYISIKPALFLVNRRLRALSGGERAGARAKKLENFGRKEKVDINEYTIEHIMPQNIDNSSAWQKELGENYKEIHEKYLHSLGNLTLTGYNSEYSNKPFLEKRYYDRTLGNDGASHHKTV